MSLVTALLVSLAIGLALLWLVCPRTGFGLADKLLLLSLGIASGLGISSLLLFLWLGAAGGNGRWEPFSAVILAIILLGGAALNKRSWRRPPAPSPLAPRGNPWLTSAFWLAAIAGISSFVLLCLRKPGGGWDGWSNWNRHAMFMFRGGVHWRDVFSAPELVWTGTYPLLLPGAIAHCWFFVGHETLLAPNAVAFLFSVAVVGLLVSSLFIARSHNQGLIAGIVLIAVP